MTPRMIPNSSDGCHIQDVAQVFGTTPYEIHLLLRGVGVRGDMISTSGLAVISTHYGIPYRLQCNFAKSDAEEVAETRARDRNEYLSSFVSKYGAKPENVPWWVQKTWSDKKNCYERRSFRRQ